MNIPDLITQLWAQINHWSRGDSLAITHCHLHLCPKLQNWNFRHKRSWTKRTQLCKIPQVSESAQFVREAGNADCRDEVKLLYGIQLKSKSEHEEDLTQQNLTILWATIMGQCTSALQEEVHGELPDYMSKLSTFYGVVWLLQSLQKIPSGVNKTNINYKLVLLRFQGKEEVL